MSGAVRREFELREEQCALLRQRSRELGVSEDELVRRAIDAMIQMREQRSTRREAWLRLRAAMEQRALMDVPQTGRSWTREDLHVDDGSY